MTNTAVRWSGTKTRFEITSGTGHSIVADEGTDLSEDAGMRPTEMLLSALGACAGVNAVLLLKKFRQPLDSLTIEVDGDREEEWPKGFTAIRINFVIGFGGPYERELVDKALDLACNRYCPVHATLTRGTRVEHFYTEAAATS